MKNEKGHQRSTFLERVCVRKIFVGFVHNTRSCIKFLDEHYQIILVCMKIPLV